MRTFEVTGSGGFLLTDNAEDISKFFAAGEEVVLYKDINDALDAVVPHIGCRNRR